MEKRLGSILENIGIGKDFMSKTSVACELAQKNLQLGFHLNKKLLHSKRYYQQNEETTYSVQKNVYQLFFKGLLPRIYKKL